jgi:glycosyltransferase involved in cell wall biosynthesis
MVNSDMVSAIIPVYNGEAYLAEAIESVLAQTFPSIELIVVDDGSTDASAAIIRSFGPTLRGIQQPNQGVGAALNTGIEAAAGNCFAFLDADDLWSRDKTERQYALLDAEPGLDAVFGMAVAFHSPELDAAARKKFFCPSEPMPGYSKSAMLIRRAAFFRAGRFSTAWQMGDFIEWYGRAKDTGLKTAMLPEVVFRRRVHAANSTTRQAARQQQYAQILKAALDRRRKARLEPEDEASST